jgi:predicted kinase
LRRADGLLFEGGRVLVDANFREEAWRRAFLEAATRWGVAGGLLLCQAKPNVVRERLASRRDDASDADWTVYLKAAETWEEPSPQTRSDLQFVTTGGSVERALSQAIDALRLCNLSD